MNGRWYPPSLLKEPNNGLKDFTGQGLQKYDKTANHFNSSPGGVCYSIVHTSTLAEFNLEPPFGVNTFAIMEKLRQHFYVYTVQNRTTKDRVPS